MYINLSKPMQMFENIKLISIIYFDAASISNMADIFETVFFTLANEVSFYEMKL